MKKLLVILTVLTALLCILSSCSANKVYAAPNGRLTYTITNADVAEGELDLPMLYPVGVVTEIGNSAFAGKDNITGIKLPVTLTTIGPNAFFNCKDLESMVIPNAVTYIGSNAFTGCQSLASIEVGEKNTEFMSINGNLYTKDGTTLVRYAPAKEEKVFTIPTGVTSIRENAFADCKNLEHVIVSPDVPAIPVEIISKCTSLVYTNYEGAKYFGNDENPHLILVCVDDSSLTSIEVHRATAYIHDSAFEGSSIQSIKFYNNILQIGNSVFKNCSELLSIEIPATVTKLGSSVFEDCTKLEEISIPHSVKNIGNGVLKGCDNLSSISVPLNVIITTVGEEKTTVEPLATLGDWFETSNNKLFEALKTVTVTSASLDNEYAFIPEYAFADCKYLTSITLPEQLSTIEKKAFANCQSLVNFVVPESVTCIDFGAFEGCKALSSITLPFVGNKKDNSINSHFGYIFGALSYAETAKIPGSLHTVEITNASNIDAYAFRYCDSLVNVYIPASVSIIGEGAFEYCENLKGLYIEDTVAWCNVSFANAYSNPLYYASNLYLNGELVTNLVIPNAVNHIDLSIFSRCDSITSVTIPETVTSIDAYSFHHCKNLTTVYYEGTNELQWKALIDDNSYYLSDVTVCYYSNNVPMVDDGLQYWHYVNGNIILW